MRKLIAPLVLLIAVSAFVAAGQQEGIQITEPANKADVPLNPTFKGTVSDPTAKVWLVVRPSVTEDYWVQAPATVNEDGTWQATINIGRPGGEDVGQRFEVAAVANPKKTIKEGDKLTYWPKSQWRSKPIKVTRR